MRQLSAEIHDREELVKSLRGCIGGSVVGMSGTRRAETVLLGRLDDAVGCGTCLGSPRSDAEQEVLPSDDKRLDGRSERLLLNSSRPSKRKLFSSFR